MDAFWSLAFPPLSRRPRPLRFGHPLVLAGLLVGLYFLQHWLNLDRHLHSPWPRLHPYWLAALGALAYLGVRLLVRLNLWTIDREETTAPEGWEDAWTAACVALSRSSATWQTRPVHLGMGETSAALEHLMAAGYRPMPEHTPIGIPFRVWSRDDSILVCANEKEQEGAGERALRLAALGQLMARRCEPRLPFLGIVTFLTLDRCSTPEEAKSAGDRMRIDVRTVTEAVGQEAPIAAVVLDAERLSGFEAWAAENVEHQRVWGIRLADADETLPLERGIHLANAVHAFCREGGPREIREAAQWGANAEAVRRNRELFRLAGALPACGSRLAAFVKHSAGAEDSESPSIVGFYLAGARAEAGVTAFFSGMPDVLSQSREFAGWTYRTIEEDWAFRRLTRWAAGGMGLAAAVLLAAGLWTVRRF